MKEELVTIDEARNKYPEEWVLMELVKFDRRKNPVAGTIVCHSPDAWDLVEPERRNHKEKPDMITYVFFCGPVIPEGYIGLISIL